MLALAPQVTWRSLFATRARADARQSAAARLTVGLLTGCVQRLVFPHVNEATVNVLAAEGLRGGRAGGARLLRRAGAARRPARRGARLRAPHHRGLRARRRRSDRRQRRRLRIVDEGVRRSCSPTIRSGPTRARAFSARVRDVTEVLASSARRERRGTRSRCASPITTPVIWRTRRASASRRAICCARFPGIELLPFAEQEICCGSAGIYNLVEPEPARSSAIGRPATSTRVQPDIVATANPGCMLQIRAGAARQQQTWSVVHPIELLDAAIRGKRVQEP